MLFINILSTPLDHRWALPVFHYPRNMVIYHYPPIEVIFMVILYVFIIKNYPNLFSNYYPKYTIWVIYPFILNLGEFIYKVTFPEHYPIVQEETAMFSFFGIMFLIDTMISNRNYVAIISIKCTRGNIIFSLFRNYFSDKNHDFFLSMRGNYHT